MNKKVRGIIIAVIVLIILGVIVWYGNRKYKVYLNELEGIESVEGMDVQVIIPEGSSVKSIAKILKENGLIEFETAFVNRVKDSEYRGQLKYGTYTLNTGMNTGEMIAIIAGGSTSQVWKTITIPEGYSAEMIADKLEQEGICSASDFLGALYIDNYDYDFLDSIPTDVDTKYKLQGFLFPATYGISKEDTPTDIVNKMLKKFGEVYSDVYKTKAEVLGYSTYDIITMASIVEREAKLEDERPTIAGVIYNRMKINMKLQMCPTVLYPLTDGKYDVNKLSYADLELDSPYNTYMYEGLPIGPICNPGQTSIYAVLYPESHSYLYYHTDDETIGNHIFSETYEEHESTIKSSEGTSEQDIDVNN